MLQHSNSSRQRRIAASALRQARTLSQALSRLCEDAMQRESCGCLHVRFVSRFSRVHPPPRFAKRRRSPKSTQPSPNVAPPPDWIIEWRALFRFNDGVCCCLAGLNEFTCLLPPGCKAASSMAWPFWDCSRLPSAYPNLLPGRILSPFSASAGARHGTSTPKFRWRKPTAIASWKCQDSSLVARSAHHGLRRSLAKAGRDGALQQRRCWVPKTRTAQAWSGRCPAGSTQLRRS